MEAGCININKAYASVIVRVGQHIFRRCVQGLLKAKTKILVSHHARFLVPADTVVRLEAGRVADMGPPARVLPTVDPTVMEQFKEALVEDSKRKIVPGAKMAAASSPRADQPFPSVALSAGGPGGDGGAAAGSQGGQENEETFERGAVKFQVYKTYFQVNIQPICVGPKTETKTKEQISKRKLKDL